MKTLVLGGVKSGKSRYAESLAKKRSEQVTYIATATAGDDAMAKRIAMHKADRPSSWNTIETPIYLGDTLDQLHQAEVVVIDCLTLWLTNLFMQEKSTLMELEITRFEEALERFPKPLIMVSNETNMGVMPMGELSRDFCDQAGLLHQRLAKVCDCVELMVAGLPFPLKHEINV